MCRLDLNLTLFDAGAAGGGAGAGAAGAAGGVAEAVVAAGVGSGMESGSIAYGAGSAGSEDANNGEGSEAEENADPELRRKEYEKLIKGDYKDFYSEDIQRHINRRYAENQQLHQQIDAYRPLMNILAAKYGVGSDNVAQIIEAIDKDNAFFEEQAMKEGMSVERYKEFMKLQAQNHQLEEAQRRAENLRQREQTYARWDRESAELAQKIPGFDLEAEIQGNRDFVRLLGSGCSVETAYTATHMNDIVSSVIAGTAKDTKKQIADSIRAGASRPVEAAAGSGRDGKTKVDISSMSSEEFKKFKEDVIAGKRSL